MSWKWSTVVWDTPSGIGLLIGGAGVGEEEDEDDGDEGGDIVVEEGKGAEGRLQGNNSGTLYREKCYICTIIRS